MNLKITTFWLKPLSLLILLSIFISFPSLGQESNKLIKILNAETLENGDGEGDLQFQRLIKNVIFEHEGAKMWCDSAHYFNKNKKFLAFGNIRIKQGDSINISANKLAYNGNIRKATLRDQVVYRDDSVTIETDNFEYDMQNKLGYYYNGGKIIDSKNHLVSDKGYYQTDTKFASFKKDAVLTTPESIIKSDTLQYDVNSRIAYFKGPTEIKQNNGTVLNATQGKYISRLEKADIRQGKLETKNYIIQGDQMLPDDLNLYYKIKSNVNLFQKKDNITLIGEEAIYNKKDSIAIIYGNPMMRKVFNQDTMYLRADTLIMIDSPSKSSQMVRAFNNVKIIKSRMAATADSLVYMSEDSLMRLDGNPIVWQNENQITADTMKFHLTSQSIKKVELFNNSFLISKDTVSLGYNQVKGINIIAHFKSDSIRKVDVFGNSETIYFLPNQDKTNLEAMNRMTCANMRITFKNGKINTIKSFKSPDGKLIPPFELKMSEEKLNNFKWREKVRPTDATFSNYEAFKKKEGDENDLINGDILEEETPNNLIENQKQLIDSEKDLKKSIKSADKRNNAFSKSINSVKKSQKKSLQEIVE